MAFRMINTKFWDDNYIIELDPIEKLLFLYFMTNSLTNICGIYEISIKRMSMDTGVDDNMIVKLLSKFSNDGRIFYIDGWIYVKNFTKHQKNSSPTVNAGIKRALKDVPDEIMTKIKAIKIPPTYPIHTPTILNPTKLNLTKLNLTKLNLTEKKFTDEDVRLTKLLYKQVKENYDFLVDRKTEKQWQADFAEMNKINRIDGRDYKTIEFIINWCQNDSFWKTNIRSIVKLRKQFDSLLVKAKSQIDKNRIVKI